MLAAPARERGKVKKIRVLIPLLAVTLAMSFPGAANASEFLSATAGAAGGSLQIDFVERGLQPGQNYDYIGSSTSATEVFQCYHPRTFTPTHRTISVTTTNFYPDVRIYQANARGIVRGFVFVYPILPPFQDCGNRLETVPVHITFRGFSLVNGVTFDYVQVTGKFSGPIEPD
jgi:hypothetical protein